MQVNSLVICIDDENFPLVAYMIGCKTPDFNIIYTVRSICSITGGILLEEIKNPTAEFKSGKLEPSFHPSRFVEIQEPMEVNIESLQLEKIN